MATTRTKTNARTKGLRFRFKSYLVLSVFSASPFRSFPRSVCLFVLLSNRIVLSAVSVAPIFRQFIFGSPHVDVQRKEGSNCGVIWILDTMSNLIMRRGTVWASFRLLWFYIPNEFCSHTNTVWARAKDENAVFCSKNRVSVALQQLWIRLGNGIMGG